MVQESAAQVGAASGGGGLERLSIHENPIHLPVRREILTGDRDLLLPGRRASGERVQVVRQRFEKPNDWCVKKRKNISTC